MSRTLDRLRRRDIAPGLHVRTPGGEFYGPFDMPGLREMAEQNRIPPGSEITMDGATWDPAESIAELKLEWSALLDDGGEYGPFNLLAAPTLVQSGIIPADAELVNRISGRKVSVSNLVKKPKLAESSIGKRPRDRVKPQSSYGDLFDNANDTASVGGVVRIKILERDLKKEQEIAAETKIAAANREKELSEKIRVLEEQNSELSTTMSEVKQDLSADKQIHDSHESRAANREHQLQRHIDQMEKDAEVAAQRITELSEKNRSHDSNIRQSADESSRKEQSLSVEIQRLRKDYTETSRTLQQTRKTSEQRQGEYEQQVERAHIKEKQLTGELAQAQLQFRKTSSQLQDAVKEQDSAKASRVNLESDFASHKTQSAKEIAKMKKQVVDFGDLAEKAKGRLEELKQTHQRGDEEHRKQRQTDRQQIQKLEKDFQKRDEDTKRLEERLRDEQASNREEASKNTRKIDLQAKEIAELRIQLSEIARKTKAESLKLTPNERTELEESAKRAEENATADEDSMVSLREANEKLQHELDRERALHSETAKSGTRREKQASAELAQLKKRVTESAQQMKKLESQLDSQQGRLSMIQSTEQKSESEFLSRIASLETELADAGEDASVQIQRIEDRYTQLEQEKNDEIKRLGLKAGNVDSELSDLTKAIEESRQENHNSLKSLANMQKNLSRQEQQFKALERRSGDREQSLKKRMTEIRNAAGKPAGQRSPLLTYGIPVVSAALFFLLGTLISKPKTESEVEAPSRLIPDTPEAAPAAEQKPQEQPPAEPDPIPESVPEPAQATPAAPDPEPQTATPEPAPAQPARITMKIDGARVFKGGDEYSIVFNEGLFSYLTVLDTEGKAVLKASALALRPYLRDHSIIAVGHTDSTALSSGAAYSSNAELGLARARAVVRFLRQHCAIPGHTMKSVSAGDSAYPYPNDTAESRKKNRTAVLRLVPLQQ